MLNIVKDFITSLFKDSNTIKLEDVLIYDEKKLVIVLSKKDYLASFEILPDFQYDFIVVNSNDETVVLNKTKTMNDIEALLSEIKEDYNAFAGQTVHEDGM